MKTKAPHRVLAAVMALVMVLLMVPFSPMNATAVANTYTLDAATLQSFSAGAKADGTSEVSADGFYTLHWNASSSIADGMIDFGAAAGAGNNSVEFTVPEGATAKITVNWVKKTDNAVMNILLADGTSLTQLTNTVAKAGDTVSNTYRNELAAGTYYVGNLDASGTIKSVSVTVTTEGTEPEPTPAPTTKPSTGATGTYVFDPDTQVTPGTDKDAIAAGTTFTNGFFTVEGTVKQRVKSGAVYCVELLKKNQGAIVFTLTDTANVTVVFSSTGTTNTSAVALLDASGNQVANKEGLTTVTGTGDTTFTYENLPAGTYKASCPETARDARLHKIVVDYGGETPPTTTPEPTPAPTTTPEPTPEPTTTPVPTEPETPPVDGDKIDVWDFGFDKLDETKYNNLLTVEKANANFYVNGALAAAGAINGGNTMGSWSIDGGDFAFAGGGKVNHRLRVNTAIEGLTAHSSGKYLTDDNGVTYNGFLYSNSGNNTGVQIQVKAKAGDILTFVHGSNGGDANVVFESPSGKQTLDTFTSVAGNSAHGEVSTFYCDVDGVYKFYYSSEKLVVARVTRQHTEEVSVTGSVTAPAELTGYSLVFTCNESGAVVKAPVAGGTYSATLREGYSYAVSLENANGYVINTGKELTIASGAASATLDVQIISVDLVTVTGNITGLDADALAALKLSFQSDAIYVPKITITGTAYSVALEKGVSYALVAEGINDYEITGSTSVSYDADAAADIVFAAKPTYAITIAPEGCGLADLAGATFTFTNLNEEGYVYTFTGPDAIALRDGVYSVKVTNAGSFVQKLTSNLTVEGAPVTKSIPFNGDVTVWNFADEDWQGVSPYNGLTFTDGKKDKTYLVSNAGTISVPVKGDCQIKISACYKYSFESDTADSQNQNTGSTSKIDTYTLTYNGGAGMATINVLSQSYITKIEVVPVVAYKETVTVGASGCDYTTIGEALEAVKAMNRPANERVTIEIQPGNYEEMLVIDVPNVTLKNASSNPSLELTNQGVDIAANAVRITSYYGHGYDYYSMNADCKWDAETLAVNKANGYASNTNPGSGTTRGSYWNATVVVTAGGFQAEGIIFENSFNQYVSQKAAEDIIVNNGGAKEGATPRAELAAGSTAVQDKKYVERAAALAIANNCKEVVFDNCKFVGRQDTLFGGVGSTVAFYDCSIYGGTDYIFGGMTAVFAKCDLVANTSEDGNDRFYITAPQTATGSHGLLMYNCHITSTVPGKDTASQYASKPGDFGRPWAADSGEAVFFNTIVDATCTEWYEQGASLIRVDGWNNTLSGQSALCGEYGTYEYAKDVDNSSKRVSWAQVFTEPTLASGEPISVETWFGSWNPFAGKDMTVVVPTEKVDNKPVVVDPDEPSTEGKTYVLDTTTDLPAMAAGEKADGDFEKAGTDNYFTIYYSAKTKIDGSAKTFEDAYEGTQRLNFGGKSAFGEATKNAIQITTENKATVKIWFVQGGDDNRQVAIFDANGNVIATSALEGMAKNSPYITELEIPEGGTYFIGNPTNNNNFYKIEVTEEAPVVSEPEEFILDTTNDLPAMAAGEKADGDFEKAGTNDFFTIYYSAKTKIDGSAKTFEDAYAGTQRLNFGGKSAFGETTKNAIQITTENKATVKIWFVQGGDDNRQVAIFDASGNAIATSAIEGMVKNSPYIAELEIPEAGTYYIGNPTNNNNFYKIQVIVEGSGNTSKPERADWATVEAPVISGATTEDGKVKVTVNANVGYDGADELLVVMYDEQGNEVATKRSIAEKGEHTLTFEPTASGKYTFKATIKREGEADKNAAADYTYDYVLPLEAPVISSATSVGAGGVEVVWNEAKEAVSYNVYVDGKLAGNTTDLKYTVTGLTVGTKYSFTVEAVRGEDKAMSNAVEATATEKAQTVWSTTIYGPSTGTGNSNGVIGDMNEDGVVTVYSEGGKGKLQYKDSDGLTYYYTAIPNNKNFTFRAKVHVDSWKYSNGQEGFGIMATDRVAPNGEPTWWSNQYMAMVSKVEYKYDHATGEVFHTNVAADVGVKYNLRLGVGVNAKQGITPENLPLLEKNDTNTILSVADGVTYPLDIAFANKNPNGNYNVVGNCEDPSALEKAGLLTVEENTDFILEIQRNNTGYFITYYDANGNIIGQKKYFDTDALSRLDTENVYVGFFAARNARATFTLEELSTIDPADDEPAEEVPVTYVTPTLSIVSPTVATTPGYTLSLLSNVSGTAYVQMHETVLYQAIPMEAGVRLDIPVELPYLYEVDFRVFFTPDPNQDLGENVKLSSTKRVEGDLQVSYNTRFRNQDVIYVDDVYGHPSNFGTKEYPLDLKTALKNVRAGQTIILMEGTYKLDSGLTIESSINGTAEKPIRMIADPDAKTRPVLDFKGIGGGLVAAGDYWYFQGFDVTRSVNGKPGFLLSGSNCVIDGVNAYHNGNTGIQLSRQKGSDLPSEWPSNNLILNCTSYGNADAGYEDADGFAAKLTCGPGNVFDGCVAHHNADDGWDLYAKVETGPIGAVTIRNCVAYSNGYLEDGTNAGNGNGFKMGGSNMPGAHKLINSYAFFNKAKGIDSNSGPDIIVENCTTFNNESYNVAFYTNINQNTNYQADGVLSIKDSSVKSGYDIADNLKPRGDQDTSKYLGATNFYWNGSASKNNAGEEVTTDIFVSTEFKGIKRNADGTIDLQGFLEKKSDANVPGGAQPGGTPSELPSLPPTENPDQPTNPTNPTNPTQPGDPSNPGTGDMATPFVWAALMLVAAFGMIAVPMSLRKRKF